MKSDTQSRTDRGYGTALDQETGKGQAFRGQPAPATESKRLFWSLAVVVVVLLVSTVLVLSMRESTQPATDPAAGEASQQVHHDSGITRAVRERAEAAQAQYDSGIAQLLRKREQAEQRHHDSGIAQLLRERERTER
ncbi:MAG TPA: hypothetical protein VM287_07825 [Egibacteraceae bacterium]|nr:hypothetical protein [Egibacteraceae bacterium]